MGRTVSTDSDWPTHDQKGNIEQESVIRVTFVRSYNRHFFKTDDMFISAGLLKKLIKEHGIKPKWKEYVEKTKPDGTVIKGDDGKPAKEWVNVDKEYIEKVAGSDLNTKERD